MDFKTPRAIRSHALSLTTITRRFAPSERD